MPDQIILLHVSDMQFGRNHRFGHLAEGDPDATFDTLLTRLTDDLVGLRDGEFKLRPDLLVVSGDLAEWGRPKEFQDAYDFVARLPFPLAGAGFVGIGPSRRELDGSESSGDGAGGAGPFGDETCRGGAG